MPGVVAKLPPGKAVYYGIEVTHSITWQGWEPGREYTKCITLKNVRVKTQKLKYKVPATRFFNTEYPQPITLSAGTSYTLPITFRPLEKVLYADQMEFSTNEGTFCIPIRAVLPQVAIEAPEKINFNMCAAHDFVQLNFEIKNRSELVTSFQIDCNDPFYIEPAEGTLEPFSSFTLTATFKPKAAVVYDANAVIKYGTGTEMSNAEITQLAGIGKYPHLLVSSNALAKSPSKTAVKGDTEAIINFGDVAIGQSAEKWIELYNLSPVNAPFSVEQPTNTSSIDVVFECRQKRGVVPAMSSIRLPISFRPITVGSKSMEYFQVMAIGNISKTVVKCVGGCIGPEVEFNRKIINFHQINAGQVATKTLDIINNAKTPATFQFLIDCDESVFKFEIITGTLPPNSKRTIILRFHPYQPINYYRRVTCLIHNQKPLFLDLIGTCHTETEKPAVLQAKHIQRYRVHADRGFSFLPPEHLNAMLREQQLALDSRGCVYDPQKDDQNLDQDPEELDPMDEFFNDGYYSEITQCPPHVSMDVHQVDFGSCAEQRNMVNQQTVTVTNHTKGKITIVWTGGPDHVFCVSPAVMDIPPNGSAPFVVIFKPSEPSQFFGNELECYAFYKSMRDYRLVEDTTHTPPWCMNLTAIGHSFPATSETFLPRFCLDSKKITFPAVNTNEATYRTALLVNTGTTPILFDFEKDQTGIFSVKPTKGLLPPGYNQVFVVKILPQQVKVYTSKLKLKMNAADKNTQDLIVCGSAETAEVLLDNDGAMFFKPTCLGTKSQRQYAVKNVSRIPLRFEWKMKHHESELLSVEPISGVIQPNENQFHTWYFTPKSMEKYVLKPTLIVWGQGQSSTSSGGKKQQFKVRAIGEGSVGELKVESTYIDFNTIVVGSQETKTITLMNDSDCNVFYKLLVDQRIDGPYAEELTRYDACAMQLDHMSGMLPARSRRLVQVTARPDRRVYYQWAVSYQLITPEGETEDPLVNETHHLCHILATGVFPSLSVIDARCYGSAIGISKKQLWGLFCLDDLNTALDADPSPPELQYTAVTSRSHNRRPFKNTTRSIIDFNFSAAPLGAQPCMVQLMFENNGASPCEWHFLMPSDLNLELDYWSETADFDNEELHEMKVMDNKLFEISPKKGKLEPGEGQTVTFTYKHIMAGTDRLPVLLKLSRGREILLSFVGVTVEPERRYLHFSSTKHMFAPVPIGEKHGPKQVYELYNGGAVTVKYQFDVLPLDIITQANYDHVVFECLNPVGEIQPGQTLNIEWKFSPLEAKTYSVDIPIKIDKGDTALITFTGIGYDKRALGDTMPLKDQPEHLSIIPDVQSVPIPGQLLFLSRERVSFGNMPLFSRRRELVAVTNKSNEHAVSFAWHLTNVNHSQIVTICPSTGILQPGERQLCRIIFTAIGFAAFYDIDLVCEVMNLTELNTYERSLTAWEKERERQKVEFTITENDLDADNRLPEFDQEERPPSGRLKSIQAARNSSPDSDLAKYKTLPPIKQDTVELRNQRAREQTKMEEELWAKPKPPKSFLLHLGITARTHDVAEFQENFSDQYRSFYVDSSLWEIDPRALAKSGESQPSVEKEIIPQNIKCIQAEADIMSGALADIIRGLLDDTLFVEACEKVVNASIPYYDQFVDTPLPHPIPSPKSPELVPGAPDITVDTDSKRPFSCQSDKSDKSVKSDKSNKSDKSDKSSKSSKSSKSKRSVSEKSANSARSDVGIITPVEVKVEDDASFLPSSAGRSSKRSKSSASVSSASSSSSSSSGSSSSKSSKHSQSALESQAAELEDHIFQDKQAVKKVPEFGATVEALLENTVSNILEEAFKQEFNITAKPRLIAMLPRQASGSRSKPNSGTKKIL